jgi:predicted amidohydrolase YtcJ
MAARLTAYVVVAIVAATLIAGLIVGAQRDDSDGPIDIIIHNAKVYTADADGTMAEAVAIRGNQILRVGSEREVTRLRRPQTTVIDAKGAAVLPGFNDAHLHTVSGLVTPDAVDLTGATTLDEMQARIKLWADSHTEARWVTGHGWFYEPFAGGLPTKQQLDALVPNRPAELLSYDGHTAWVNSRALKLAGITKKTPNPPNGIIVKDARTGEPTGVLKEAAIGLVSRHVPATTRAERLASLRATIEDAHRNGVTSIQDAAAVADDLDLYAEARRDGELLVRIYAALKASGAVSEQALADLDALVKKYPDDPFFKSGAISIALDGSIESQTAAMLTPYADSPTDGVLMVDPDAFNRTVRLLDARGWQVLAEATGDRAVRVALNAYEHAVRSNPVPERGRRHRVEHVETVDADDLPRFGALGVIASLQPYRGNPSPNQIDLWTRNIGIDRASRGWPYGSIARGAGKITFGSDWPTVTLNPMFGLHTAVTRTTPEGQAADGASPADGWYPSERLALKAAIDGYTRGAAWASFDEQRKGTLAPGMLADIVVLSENIFDAPPARLGSTRVAVTIFDGKIVYRRDAAGTTN